MAMFDVAASFNLLCLNDTEIGLFTGIVLCSAGWLMVKCFLKTHNIESTETEQLDC